MGSPAVWQGFHFEIVLGRKGKLKEIILGFSDTDFHHLAGLHKLKDISKKIYPYSSIESEYLLKMGDGIILNIAFLFLDRSEQGVYFCRSFFPMDRTDYTKEQMQYTLLKKEKRNLATGQVLIQFDRLSPRK